MFHEEPDKSLIHTDVVDADLSGLKGDSHDINSWRLSERCDRVLAENRVTNIGWFESVDTRPRANKINYKPYAVPVDMPLLGLKIPKLELPSRISHQNFVDIRCWMKHSGRMES
jgi:hypothetical protein